MMQEQVFASQTSDAMIEANNDWACPIQDFEELYNNSSQASLSNSGPSQQPTPTTAGAAPPTRNDNRNDQTSKQMATTATMAATTPMRTDDERNDDMIICLSARMSAVRLTDHSSKLWWLLPPPHLFQPTAIINASRNRLHYATFITNPTRPSNLSPDSDLLPPKWQPCEIIEIEKSKYYRIKASQVKLHCQQQSKKNPTTEAFLSAIPNQKKLVNKMSSKSETC
jgi:hypothetical protein